MKLYKLDSTNTLRWWKIEQTGNEYHISWASADSPNINTNKYTCLTPEKAEQEVQSRINRQIERRGYSATIPKTQPDLPMLAQKWNDHITRVDTNKRQPFKSVAIQPKLDGMRCIGSKSKMTTRRNEQISSCPHIEFILSYLPEGVKLDGELYIHRTDLQVIQSIVRRKQPDRGRFQCVKYFVYDLVDLELNFVDRYEKLSKVVQELRTTYDAWYAEYSEVPKNLRSFSYVPVEFPIELVETHFYNCKSDDPQLKTALDNHFYTYTADKYEGCMIRNSHSTYQINHRSPDLLKYKMRQDHEFEIIDVVECHDQTGKFICKTEDGKIFDCSPSWTTQAKRRLLHLKDKYIGKWLTVEFETYSIEGKPLKGVGKATHDRKDKD